MLNLTDGKGSGNKASVNSDNMLRCASYEENYALFSNAYDKQAYAFVIETVTPTGAADYFCYMKNSSDKDMIVDKLEIYEATADAVDITVGMTGTPTGGTAETPANKNAGSSNTPDGTFQYGVNITVITGGSVVGRLRVPADSTTHEFTWDSGFVIPNGSTFVLSAVTGTTALSCTVHFYYREPIA